MGSYAIPGVSMIPRELYLEYKAKGFTFIDPANLELSDTAGKGMLPWTRFIEMHCDAVIAITSMNVVTAGVQIEMETASRLDIPMHWPYLTSPKPNVLPPEQSRFYNQLGLLVLEVNSNPSRFTGFIATVNHNRHQTLPEIIIGQS